MVEFNLIMGTIGDLDLLVAHRLLMWKDIHPELASEIDESRAVTKNWIQSKILEGSLVSFIVKTTEGSIAGSGCILVKEDQPRPGSKQLKFPYLMSMYTAPEFRRKGVASLIVTEAIRWSRQNNYDRISLHASKEGVQLYKKFGFIQTNEMRLKLDD
ncbi:MAG: GNAT family N-acetyltransferase [Thermoplasmatales archaeon]|jgi:GNAT superfamily N-acetyltransferase